MTTERTIDDVIHERKIMDEWNAKAKAEGRYLDTDPWEIPRQPGSILDVPETPESRERIARLRARRLARMQAAAQKAGSVEQLQEEVRETVQGQLPGETPENREGA